MAADDMTGVWFSPSECAIYVDEFRAEYEASGSWPEDAYQLQRDEVDMFYAKRPPEGMTLGSGEWGEPMWVPWMPSTDIQVNLADRVRETYGAELLAEIQVMTAKAIVGDETDKGKLKALVEMYEQINGGRS